MKRVYLVRHGATGGNEAKAYQHLNTPLSEKGRTQSAQLAERLTKIPFDLLVVSTMTRARETAQIISERTGHPVLVEHLFHEILRPSAVRGKLHADTDAASIIRETDALWDTQSGKHSDEENFFDLKGRAIQALQFLIDRQESTIVVVTHGTMLNMLITVMLSNAEADPELFERMNSFIYSNNTGITWCAYDADRRPNPWKLVTWDDHAHLG